MRELAIALLDDEHGISTNAWKMLSAVLEEEGNNEDILNAVKAQDGRFFLPEGWQE